MRYSSSGSCQKTMWIRTRICAFLLLTLEVHLIEYQEKLFGGPCKNLGLRNGCSTAPEVKLEFCTGTPWEFLYDVDLVIITETEDELKMKLIK